MTRRVTFLLFVGAVMGLWVGSLLDAGPARAGEEVPGELQSTPREPTARARDLSRPFVEATRKCRPCVVRIVNLRKGRGGRLQPTTSGSGVIISSEGHILTNRHVIEGADELQIHLQDGRRLRNVKTIGTDPRSDVGLVRIEGAKQLPVATLGDSDTLEVGEWVIAIGAPFDLESSVSAGIVSATGRTRVLSGAYVHQEFIQTDAALNPGNSGGPLINLDGQVVGINTAIHTGNPATRSSAGVGFAVPINLARTIAISLIKHGVAKRGVLGIHGTFLTADALQKRGLTGYGGFRVEEVVAGSGAQAAGIKVEDILLEIDSRALKDPRTLLTRLASAGAGGTIEVKLQRGTQTRTVSVTLGEESVYDFGITVRTLNAELARGVGAPADLEAVVVTRVDSDSPAASQILPGDIIIGLEASNRLRWRIGDRQDFLDAMVRLQSTAYEQVLFRILSEGRGYKVLIPAPRR